MRRCESTGVGSVRGSSRFLASFAVFLVAGLASACAHVTPPREINEKYRAILDQRHNNYRLKDGDTLDIRMYQAELGDLNQTDVVVLPDGRSDLLFLDQHVLGGKTVAQLENEYRQELAVEVREAEVSIQVTPREEEVYIIGQFERPGVVELEIGMTLQRAIAAVGGVKVSGDTDWALLRRPYLSPRNPDLFRIDLNDESEEIFLLPGDQVVLGRTFLAGVANYLREYLFSILPGSPVGYATVGAAF